MECPSWVKNMYNVFFLYFCPLKSYSRIMSTNSNTGSLNFHRLSLSDMDSVRGVTLSAGRRNCNFTFANLIGWQFWFKTEVCLYQDAVLLRFDLDSRRAYMVCSATPPSARLLELLCHDASFKGSDLLLMGLEDDYAAHIQQLFPQNAVVTPRRNQYDYLYLRQELAEVKGKNLKAKRNHINKFISEHPDFRYVPLAPGLFDECRALEKQWLSEVGRDDIAYNITTDAEMRAMENVFCHWEQLDMYGGCIYVGDRMVAFTYGSPVTHDTLDVCVEKADRRIDGAFNIINQQFAAHLPEQFVYLNREEDMGLEGLRKSKLSYHPHLLITYNNVEIKCQ